MHVRQTRPNLTRHHEQPTPTSIDDNKLTLARTNGMIHVYLPQAKSDEGFLHSRSKTTQNEPRRDIRINQEKTAWERLLLLPPLGTVGDCWLPHRVGICLKSRYADMVGTGLGDT